MKNPIEPLIVIRGEYILVAALIFAFAIGLGAYLIAHHIWIW